MLVLDKYIFQDITLELQHQKPASNEGEGVTYYFKLTGLDFLTHELFVVQTVDGVLRQRTGNHIRSGWGRFGPQQEFEVALKQLLSIIIEKRIRNLSEEIDDLKKAVDYLQ